MISRIAIAFITLSLTLTSQKISMAGDAKASSTGEENQKAIEISELKYCHRLIEESSLPEERKVAWQGNIGTYIEVYYAGHILEASKVMLKHQMEYASNKFWDEVEGWVSKLRTREVLTPALTWCAQYKSGSEPRPR